MARIRKDIVTRTHVEVEIVNIAADLLLREAKKKLQQAKLDPARFLVPAGRTAFEQVLDGAGTAGLNDRATFLAKGLGHRSALDYELAEPRYAESPAEMLALRSIGAPELSVERLDEEILRAPGGEKVLAAVQIARRLQTLKEDAKHHSLREIAVLRRAVLALDRRLGLGGLTFHLRFEEIELLGGPDLESLRTTAAERKRRAAVLASEPALPAKLTVVQLEDRSAGIAIDNRSSGGNIAGTRVSGTGVVEGRACVVTDGTRDIEPTIPGFRDGDIVVSRMVPPAWIPYFKRAGGFVCEVGGWLSHTAIVARECNVPLIVGAEGVDSIQNGMLLRLHSNGVVEIVAEAPVAVAAE
jgi:rifampicin phosphotransferase